MKEESEDEVDALFESDPERTKPVVVRRAKNKIEVEEVEEKPAPKRRGRPPKKKAEATEAEEKSAPKRRGRPPKMRD